MTNLFIALHLLRSFIYYTATCICRQVGVLEESNTAKQKFYKSSAILSCSGAMCVHHVLLIHVHVHLQGVYLTCWSFDEQVQVLLSLLVIILPHHADAITCACATDAVRCRSSPGISNTQVHVMYPRECLEYLGESTRAGAYLWRKIRLNNDDVAWVPSDWVELKFKFFSC